MSFNLRMREIIPIGAYYKIYNTDSKPVTTKLTEFISFIKMEFYGSEKLLVCYIKQQ